MKLLSDAIYWMTRYLGLYESASKFIRLLVCAFPWFLLVIVSGCSISPETKAEEGAWLALQTIDTAQTANIARTPGAHERESAWIIGREPSPRSAYAYMGSMALLHVGIATYMDTHDWPRWERRIFEALTLVDASQCVIGNYRAGISAHF